MRTGYWRIAALAVVFGLFTLTVRAGEDAAAQAGQAQQQVSVTPAELLALLTGEAEKGNAQAMVNLGQLYENGVGVRRNFTTAFEWYAKAAQAMDPAGYMRLGASYEIGLGTTVDLEKAFQNYEKAASLQLPDGLYKLAEMYIHGLGVDHNQAWGVSLLERAEKAGHLGAANDLGLISFEGLYGKPKDLEKAREMFIHAAELGSGEAMKNVGVIYREGLGVDANPIEAMKWYFLAFEAGFNRQGLMPLLQSFEQELTKEEIEDARSQAQAWLEAFHQRQQPPVAPPAAGQ